MSNFEWYDQNGTLIVTRTLSFISKAEALRYYMEVGRYMTRRYHELQSLLPHLCSGGARFDLDTYMVYARMNLRG